LELDRTADRFSLALMLSLAIIYRRNDYL
jgi:hypothetical protein